MTTQELINQFVTTHADNRLMDVSELIEFARKLKEPASEDLADASNNYCLNIRKGYPRVKDEIDIFICNAFKAGAEWQKEQMMKDAIDATVTSIRKYREENEVDFTIMLDKGIVPYVSEEDVKLIIIKE